MNIKYLKITLYAQPSAKLNPLYIPTQRHTMVILGLKADRTKKFGCVTGNFPQFWTHHISDDAVVDCVFCITYPDIKGNDKEYYVGCGKLTFDKLNDKSTYDYADMLSMARKLNNKIIPDKYKWMFKKIVDKII